jgi:hypothetical protein
LAGAGGPTDTWASGVDLADTAQSRVVTGPAAVEQLRSAAAGTRFTQRGVTYSVAARMLLPGETSCG